MPGSYRVIISPDAIDDLDRIFSYIQAYSPQNAGRVVDRLLRSIEGLGQFPGRFTVVHKKSNLPFDVHSMPVTPFRVLCRIVQEQAIVWVLTVRHGRQQPWP